jgi:aminoglycoside phosphotransferase family enzyme/predicted kinase
MDGPVPGPAPAGPPAALVETHVSVLVMVGDRVYKLCKPVDLGFVDHRTREARLRSCRAEVALNRRLAPDVYLGVSDVTGPDGAPCDHLVVMRRLPDDRRLGAMLGHPGDEDAVRAVADTLSRFHAGAATSPAIAASGGPDALRGLWEEQLAQCAPFAGDPLDAGDLAEAGALALEWVDGRRDVLAARAAAGLVRDGHGDLLADDVFVLDDGPRILDCLAFSDRYRHGDVLLDVAFLAMDLEWRGHAHLARVLRDAHRPPPGPAAPVSLWHHYVAYRAHVRSKVACLRMHQGAPAAAADARGLHDLALRHLRAGRVRLVLVGGAPGTGKTALAGALAAARGLRVVASDEVRREMLGPGAGPVPPGAGRYAPEARARVYAECLARAGARLAAGESVVLDASWTRDADREDARALARAGGAGLLEVRCEAPAEVAVRRIRARAAAGEGASEADEAVADALRRAADPWPQAVGIDTAGPLADALASMLAALDAPS